jgi:hypothetical protein
MANQNEDPFDDGFTEDPFIDDHFSNQKGGNAYSYQDTSSIGITPLPDASTVLVLGILAILGSFCYGIFGLILGVVALGVSGRPARLLRESPNSYSVGSISNFKAGKVCAIVGLCISGVYIFALLGILLFAIN